MVRKVEPRLRMILEELMLDLMYPCQPEEAEGIRSHARNGEKRDVSWA